MRKVLSLVLTLTLVLGSLGFTSAFAATTANFSDIVGLDCESSVDVLVALGVVEGYDDGTYKPENIVTRAEMSKLIITALGMGDFASASTSKFSDVKGHWAEAYISYAESLGILNGYPDGTFKPGQTVTYNEAATIMVRGLGYRDSALTGGWPGNYVDKAVGLEILKDINTSGAAGASGAVRGDIAIMLYQTLKADIGTINNDGAFEATRIGYDDDDNPIYDCMLNRLGAEYNSAEIITASLADDALVNIREYIGAYASYFTLKDDNTVLTIDDVKSTMLEGKYEEKNNKFVIGDTEYSVTMTGDKSDNVPKYSTDKDSNNKVDAMEFVNTDDKGNLTTKKLVDGDYYRLAVDLSGKTIRKVYSVHTWNVDAHMVFENDDANFTASTPKIGGIEFNLDDDRDLDTKSFELNGTSTLDTIAVGDVVYVYKNDDKKVVRIAVGTESAEGKLTRVTDDEKEVSIDSDDYDVADPASDDSDTFRIGDEGIALLDYFGLVYEWEIGDGTAGNYGVVLGINNQDGTTDAKVKLHTKDDVVKTYTINSKVKTYTYDNVGKEHVDTKVKDVDFETEPGFAVGKVVKYALNSDGEITRIYEMRELGLSLSGSNKVNVSKSGSTISDGTSSYAVDANLVGFAAPYITPSLGSSYLDYDDMDVIGRSEIADTSYDTTDQVRIFAEWGKNSNKVVAGIFDDAEAGTGGDYIVALVNKVQERWSNSADDSVDYVTFVSELVRNDENKLYGKDLDMFDGFDATSPYDSAYAIKVSDDNIITKAERIFTENNSGTGNYGGGDYDKSSVAYLVTEGTVTSANSETITLTGTNNSIAMESGYRMYLHDGKEYEQTTTRSDMTGKDIIAIWLDDDDDGYSVVIIIDSVVTPPTPINPADTAADAIETLLTGLGITATAGDYDNWNVTALEAKFTAGTASTLVLPASNAVTNCSIAIQDATWNNAFGPNITYVPASRTITIDALAAVGETATINITVTYANAGVTENWTGTLTVEVE